MTLMRAKWINKDAQSLEDDGSGALQVFVDASGAIERTVTGINVKSLGITNGMLAGSIALSKLAEAVIQADGGQAFTGDQSMGLNRLTNLGAPVNPNDAVRQTDLDSAVTGLDFQADVDDIQTDGTLDPGASPSTGDRYIVTDTATLHANFGTITGVENNDIVEYDGADFVVEYDVSVEGPGALVWDLDSGQFYRWDGTSWDPFGGLSGVTAGAGLTKSSNTLNVGQNSTGAITVNADDIAINYDDATIGITGSGPGSLIVKNAGITEVQLASSAFGNGLQGGSGTVVSVQADSVGGANIASAISVTVNGVGVLVDADTIGVNGSNQLRVNPDSIGATEVDLSDTFDFATAGGTVQVPTQTQGDGSTNAASTDYVDTAIAAVSAAITIIVHVITGPESTNGFFTLPSVPNDPAGVQAFPQGGPEQVNKQTVGGSGVTPDFDILNSDEFHFNNNGAATGLSEDIAVNDELVVKYFV